MEETNIASKVSGLDKLLRMQFDQPAQKRLPAYGQALARQMWSYITDTNVGYYSGRYTQWKLNENWMKGVVDETEFRSYMGVEGNKSWLNMDFTVIKVIPRYMKAIINRFMDREEQPSVKATDLFSVNYKEREKLMAKVRMKEALRIKQMQAVSGMNLTPDQFTPKDSDDLDVYYKIKYKMPEEAFMEKAVWQVFQNSDYENLKGTLIRDCLKTNLMVTKLKELPYTKGKSIAERLRVIRCDPKNVVYNIFKESNGKDITIIGYAYALKISDARREYPNVPEQQWFKLAQIATKGLEQAEPLNWTDTWVYSLNRPYDDFAFINFDFEVRTYDTEYYVKQKDSEGDDMLIAKKGKPKNLGADKVLEESGRFNNYCGVYAPVADVMLDWYIAPNQIRPFQNGVDCFSSFSVQYPDADGFYVPALVERGIPPVRQLILTALKTQQMLSLMEADNIDVDISGMHQLDIGTGKKLKPIEVLKYKKQTGIGWYDSSDDTGVDDGRERKSPYESRSYAANVAQINVLIGLYNFWLQRLNDEWGETPESIGQPTAAKKSALATKQAISAGTGGTEYVYDAFTALMETNATKIVYRLWDMLVLEVGGYKEAAGIDRDLMNATFDVNINMIDKRGKRERLAARIQEMLDSKVITASMAERLEEIDDPKDAILYLELVEKQQREAAMAKQKQDINLNAQVQQQSTEIATQGKIQLEIAKAQAKALVEHLKSDDTAFRDLLGMVNDAEKEAQKIGGQLPPDLVVLKDIMTQAVLQKQAKTEQQMQQGQPGQQQPQQQGQMQPQQ